MARGLPYWHRTGLVAETVRLPTLDYAVLRQEAKARLEARGLVVEPHLDPTFLFIHHSAAPDDQSWEEIRRFHVEHRKFNDISYNCGLSREGGTWHWIMGRPWIKAGAHTSGFNHLSLGFVLLGNYSKQPPAPEPWTMLVSMLKDARLYLNLTPDKILGHVESYAMRGVPKEKDCPGFSMERLRQEVA